MSNTSTSTFPPYLSQLIFLKQDLPWTEYQLELCNRFVTHFSAIFTSHQPAEVKQAIEFLFLIGKSCPNQKMFCQVLNAIKFNFDYIDGENREVIAHHLFKTLLYRWGSLNDLQKKKVVNIFLLLKYETYDDEPLSTDVLIPKDFENKDQLDAYAKQIISKEDFATQEKMFEFASDTFKERTIPAAQILIENSSKFMAEKSDKKSNRVSTIRFNNTNSVAQKQSGEIEMKQYEPNDSYSTDGLKIQNFSSNNSNTNYFPLQNNFPSEPENESEPTKSTSRINILVVGANGIGKSCLINQFLALKGKDKLKEEVSTKASVTFEFDERLYFDKRTYQEISMIDSPGYVIDTTIENEHKNSSPDVTYKDFRDYYGKIINLLSKNAPHKMNAEKIHHVLFCYRVTRFEDWQYKIINAIAEFAPVSIVHLYCIGEESEKHLEELKKEKNLKNVVSGFYPVLARDIICRGKTIDLYGMHDLAKGIAKDLEKWQKQQNELQELFEKEKKAYYKILYKKGLAIIAGFAAANAVAGLSPLPFLDSAAIIPLHAGMFSSLTKLFGIETPLEILKVIAHGLWAGAAANVPAVGFRLAIIGLNYLKFIPVFNLIAMAGAAGLHAIFTTISGVTFLTVLKRKAINGELDDITVDNAAKILREMNLKKEKLLKDNEIKLKTEQIKKL